MKMLERKRVEANCVRMVQGTARRRVFVSACYRLRVIECSFVTLCDTYATEASALVTKILTVNAGLEAELQACDALRACACLVSHSTGQG